MSDDHVYDRLVEARTWATRWKRAAKIMQTRWHQAELGLANMLDRADRISSDYDALADEKQRVVASLRADLAAARERETKLREVAEYWNRWSTGGYFDGKEAERLTKAALAPPADPTQGGPESGRLCDKLAAAMKETLAHRDMHRDVAKEQAARAGAALTANTGRGWVRAERLKEVRAELHKASKAWDEDRDSKVIKYIGAAHAVIDALLRDAGVES